MRSDQEETDTRVVLYINYAQSKGFKSVVVRTPDTDIFFILLHHAHDLQIAIFIDTGTGKHRRTINISELAKQYGREWCTTHLSFYVFTGEDCTSAFKGRGKVAPLKKLMKYPKFHAFFSQLGDEWSVEEETHKMIEDFTCSMYGYPKEKSINNVRAKMLRKMVGKDQLLNKKSKIDLARLPPCQDSLDPHVQRVNYRLACYKRANQSIYERPKPFETNQGWHRSEHGELEPVWSRGPIILQSLVDLLETTNKDEEDFEEKEEQKDDIEIETDDDDELEDEMMQGHDDWNT